MGAHQHVRGDNPNNNGAFIPLFVKCHDGNQIKALIFIFSKHLMFMCGSIFEYIPVMAVCDQ